MSMLNPPLLKMQANTTHPVTVTEIIVRHSSDPLCLVESGGSVLPAKEQPRPARRKDGRRTLFLFAGPEGKLKSGAPNQYMFWLAHEAKTITSVNEVIYFHMKFYCNAHLYRGGVLK